MIWKVSDLPDRLSADSLLYAADVKLIAPLSRHDIHQSSLNISASWSRDWELDLNPTKSEHLPIGNSPHFATYTLPSHNLPNTQNIPTVSTTKALAIVLNTRLSAEDHFVSAANKACRMLFYLKRSFAAFKRKTKRLSAHILNILFKQPIPPYAATPRHRKRCRSSLWSLWKGFGMSHTKQPSNSFVYSPSHTGETVEI